MSDLLTGIVKLTARGDGEERVELGATLAYQETPDAIFRRLMGLYWDSRLDCVSVVGVLDHKELDPEELQEALDELVCEARDAEAISVRANAGEAPAEADLDVAGRQAAALNNSGPRGQIGYLLDQGRYDHNQLSEAVARLI
ncbi:hypothetical protein [Thioalkalivibrio thiocyanodenitrificans]|uniref:hypothetical protein n=1 Tax=Thioalkalivibrio thiocyanodenitrificans TaxID=243063 RepID=UPI000478298D|nr:hypothetical protein [Thioalkalivibrio thiocyanodenitrificans]